jgi:hypothetical protein
MDAPAASRPTPDWLGGAGLLPWSWAVERLTAERNYWVVSVRRDGFPQARPVWGVWHETGLFLSVGHGGLQRTSVMDARPAVPATVHVDSAVDVVIIEGVIDRVGTNDYEGRRLPTLAVPMETRDAAAAAYIAKYSAGPGAESLDLNPSLLNFLVRPRVVYGWRGEDVKTATKWTFPAR